MFDLKLNSLISVNGFLLDFDKINGKKRLLEPLVGPLERAAHGEVAEGLARRRRRGLAVVAPPRQDVDREAAERRAGGGGQGGGTRVHRAALELFTNAHH